jgi:hypothetical protein
MAAVWGPVTRAFVLPTIGLETAPLDFQTMRMIVPSPQWRILLASEEMVSVSSTGPTSKRQSRSVAMSWHPPMSMVLVVVELIMELSLVTAPMVIRTAHRRMRQAPAQLLARAWS